MGRPDAELAELASQFELVRVVNMRGVDLTVFDFDYDLTWAAFFLNADEQVYGRFGGRDAGPAEKYLTVPALKVALRAALTAHRAGRAMPRSGGKPVAVEHYPAASRLRAGACIHCHHVYEFRREQQRAAGTWRREDIWVYPLPENLGFRVEEVDGSRVASITPDSPAARAGLRAGDRLHAVQGLPVVSFGDLQYALHRAPEEGTLTVAWLRAGQRLTGQVELPRGWRKTDIAWRESMWGLEPAPCVFGEDLDSEEKRELGLDPRRLAFRQGRFVPAAAKMTGIRSGDIILGIDGKALEMTMRQFNAWVRLHYKVGDRITFNLIRDGKRLDLPMILPARVQF